MKDIRGERSVSVLVPIYNSERYLTQCLDSLLCQTLPDIEIICLDDGSTDASATILARYAARDSRIVVRTHENHGYGWTLNRGLDEATGEYVGIVESDDWVEPSMFEDLYHAACSADADMAKCNFYMEWTSDPKRRKLYQYCDARDDGCVVRPRQDPRGTLLRKKPTVWSAVYRRSFLDENRIRFQETPGASFQDTSVNFKALWLADSLVCVATPYVHYRQDNEVSSINSKEKAYCVCDEYEEIERFIAGFSAPDPVAARIFAPMVYDTFIWNYERLSSDLKGPFLEVASRWFRRLLDEGQVDWSGFTEGKRTNFHVIAYAPMVYDMWKQGSAPQPVGKKQQGLISAIKEWMRSFVPPSRRRFTNKMQSLSRQVEALQITVDELVRQNNALSKRS